MRYLVGIDKAELFLKQPFLMRTEIRFQFASVPTETLTPKPGYTEKNLDELWEVNAQAIRQAVEKVELILRILQVFPFPVLERDFT